ncbi:MAG: NADH-quinone oxidoreductase subunit N, partial [Elusimicrobia bacterium]
RKAGHLPRALSALGALAAAGYALSGADGSFGLLALEPVARLWQLLFCAAALLFLAARGPISPRSAALLSGSLCGMSVLAGATNLPMLFLGLELMSLPLYLLLHGLRPDARSLEAALKYFFAGAVAAGLFLFGMAAWYASTGSFALADVPHGGPMAAVGAGLLVASALFKLGAFPFMFWLPDAYEAAEAELAAFMATGVKAAGALMLMRLLPLSGGTLETAVLPWVAAATMAAGNVMALRQSDLQRLLAWSSVAHAGYILAALWAWRRLGGAPAAASTVALYLLLYVAASAGAFLSLKALGASRREDLPGLAARSPLTAGLLALFLVSLGGLPPTGGFVAKFFVLWDLWRAGSPALAAAVALASLVGLGYYLSLVRALAIDAAPEKPAAPAPRWGLSAALAVCALLTLVSGVMPGLRAGLEAALR